ncbi:hypothetical protein C8Q79DRAFT_76055 [Trametes meyenii]|nr:hypothetical protein C8Q79DRAFT_76055 [Trametes meyenii]
MDSGLPPAPRLDGDAMLEVFVHSSMRFAGVPLNSESPYTDGARLAVIGDKVLQTAYTDAYFNKTPKLKADELKEQVKQLDEDVVKWVDGYRWREKVRHTPDINLRSTEETRTLFNSYVGAVFVAGGYQAVRDWIGALVDPQAQPSVHPGLNVEPGYKRPKIEPGVGMGGAFQQSQVPQWHPQSTHFQMYGQPLPPAPPPPPAIPPPPLPMNPLAPAQPHSAFLPLFNQTAQQRRLEVSYPAQFSGPAHAGRWTVHCMVNGMEKGIGTGSSKQLAKEEAARQAYHNMGGMMETRCCRCPPLARVTCTTLF